jgi:hypothetical protein
MMKSVQNLISYLQEFSQIFLTLYIYFLHRNLFSLNFWKWKFRWQVGPTVQPLCRRTPCPDWLTSVVPRARAGIRPFRQTCPKPPPFPAPRLRADKQRRAAAFLAPPAITNPYAAACRCSLTPSRSQASRHLFPSIAGAVAPEGPASFLLSGEWAVVVAAALHCRVHPDVLTPSCHRAQVVTPLRTFIYASP